MPTFGEPFVAIKGPLIRNIMRHGWGCRVVIWVGGGVEGIGFESVKAEGMNAWFLTF